jgi:hypothetical protein
MDVPQNASPSTLAKHHNDRCGFFNLPNELRDMIYEYVWEGGLLFFHYKRIRVEVFSRKYSHFQKGLPPWLLACGRMLNEALATLHRTGTYRQIKTCSSQYISDKHNLLLFIGHIKNVQLSMETWDYAIREGSSSTLYWAMSEKDALFVKYLEEVDVKNVTMFCKTNGGDGRVVSAEIYGRTVPLQVLPGRCKAIVVHAELHTLISSSEHCRRRELMDTVTGVAERWAKRVFGERSEGRQGRGFEDLSSAQSEIGRSTI